MKGSIRDRETFAFAAGALAALAWCSCVAQDTATAQREVLQEVVVTAQKRSEDIQDVPIAVTAVTAQDLERKGIRDVATLSNVAPNVTLDAGTPFSGSDTVLAAYIRGIGQNDFAFNQDPGVGIYIDGVYLARSVGANTSMLDVGRVEILKGPQGSLFGRNTIGGAISIVTRDPGREFMLKGEVTAGQYNRMDVQITADLPISERLLSSISFSSAKRDGYQRRIPFAGPNVADGTYNNPFANIPDCGPLGTICSYVSESTDSFPSAGYESSSRQGGQDQWNMRGKLVFLASDAVKLTLTGDYSNIDQPAQANSILAVDSSFATAQFGLFYNGCLAQNTPIPGGIPAGSLVCGARGGLTPTLQPFLGMPALGGINNDGNPSNNQLPYDARFIPANVDTTYATANSFSKLKAWGVATTLDWSLTGALSLKWINAYRDLQWSAGTDQDASPMTILSTSFTMPQHELSEELQLNGKAFDERLNFVVGAYYFRESGHLGDLVTFPGALLTIDSMNDLTTTAKAIYAHLNFKVTDKFAITAGARYTKEHKEFEGHQADDNGFVYKIAGCFPPLSPSPVPGVNCRELLGFPTDSEPLRFYPPGVSQQDFKNTSPTFGVEYHVSNDVMTYASWSKGYKTGSWTTRLSLPHATYDPSLFFGPEFATAEEIGLKSEWLDHRLRTNVAAFHTKYDGIQLNSQIGISPTLVNAGDARIYGAEIEAQMLVGGGLSVSSAIGYANAEYIRLNNVSDNGLPVTLTSCPERTSDPNHQCALPKTPEWKVYVGPQYEVRLSNGAAVRLNADWTYTSKTANDFGNTEQLMRGSVNMVNASVTYQAPGGHWELSIGGTNLADERYIMNGFNQGGIAVIFGSYSPPREWFATFRFRPEANSSK
jgi:outer membrane receptor protein involved in Fe transport